MSKTRIKFLVDGLPVIDLEPLDFYMRLCLFDLSADRRLPEGSRFTCIVQDGDIKIMASDEFVTYK